jgi:hypothetical protein
MTGIFCGKLFRCPASDPGQQSTPQEIRVNTRLSCNSPRQATRDMTALQQTRAASSAAKSKAAAK